MRSAWAVRIQHKTQRIKTVFIVANWRQEALQHILLLRKKEHRRIQELVLYSNGCYDGEKDLEGSQKLYL